MTCPGHGDGPPETDVYCDGIDTICAARQPPTPSVVMCPAVWADEEDIAPCDQPLGHVGRGEPHTGPIQDGGTSRMTWTQQGVEWEWGMSHDGAAYEVVAVAESEEQARRLAAIPLDDLMWMQFGGCICGISEVQHSVKRRRVATEPGEWEAVASR